MSAVKLALFYLLFKSVSGLSGNFWHVTDLHWDPSYRLTDDPEQVCASSGSIPANGAGNYGDYVCDSPLHLINSSILAMKKILPDPDFIVWTGDDTPHVPDEDLGEDAVLDIIRKLTQIIKTVFPTTKVYTALGNHDYHPKNQLPENANNLYSKISEMWEDWLEPESRKTFRLSGYYSEKLLNQTGFRIMVLNTNLYYDQNKTPMNTDDPGGQFQWADNILTEASKNQEKVYIIGHVPPGFFEKKRSKAWFRSHFNERYLQLIQKHHPVILGQFFGHHHTDSFRMFYDTQGKPISTMFLSPGVTPWMTTLPGVVDGANNPGIRIFEYNTETLLVKDVVTYYLNLTHANRATERWEKEYRLTESFNVNLASPSSMHRVLERIASEPLYLQKYYEFNSVNYDRRVCDEDCRVDHVCAAREVDFERYERCLVEEGAASLQASLLQILFVATALTLTGNYGLL